MLHCLHMRWGLQGAWAQWVGLLPHCKQVSMGRLGYLLLHGGGWLGMRNGRELERCMPELRCHSDEKCC